MKRIGECRAILDTLFVGFRFRRAISAAVIKSRKVLQPMSKTPFFCILAKKSPGLVKEVDCLSKLVSTIVDAEIESFPLTKISVFSA